jgi:hypothetical protein
MQVLNLFAGGLVGGPDGIGIDASEVSLSKCDFSERTDESVSDVRDCATAIQEAICHPDWLECFALSRTERICPNDVNVG